jgi:hypothetical protein
MLTQHPLVLSVNRYDNTPLWDSNRDSPMWVVVESKNKTKPTISRARHCGLTTVGSTRNQNQTQPKLKQPLESDSKTTIK